MHRNLNLANTESFTDIHLNGGVWGRMVQLLTTKITSLKHLEKYPYNHLERQPPQLVV
jgi:hypothetical protein